MQPKMNALQLAGMRRLQQQSESQRAQKMRGHTDVIDVADARQIAIQRIGSLSEQALGSLGSKLSSKIRAGIKR